jgi:hypothetical protein
VRGVRCRFQGCILVVTWGNVVWMISDGDNVRPRRDLPNSHDTYAGISNTRRKMPLQRWKRFWYLKSSRKWPSDLWNEFPYSIGKLFQFCDRIRDRLQLSNDADFKRKAVLMSGAILQIWPRHGLIELATSCSVDENRFLVEERPTSPKWVAFPRQNKRRRSS